MKTQAQLDIEWERLSRLRWAGAGDHPLGIVVGHDWRSEVAAWPHEKWSRWWNRVTALLAENPERADRDVVSEMERRAWEEMRP